MPSLKLPRCDINLEGFALFMNKVTNKSKNTDFHVTRLELDVDAALASFGDVVEQLTGKKPMTARTTRYAFAPAPKRTPKQIARIRKRFAVSQEAFAALLNVPRITVASWETGAKKPSGAALRLLEIAERYSQGLRSSFKKSAALPKDSSAQLFGTKLSSR
jgi:putative transcriptional regulator